MALRTVWLFVVSAILVVPFAVFLAIGADFTFVASEALGYRFFYSMRVLAATDTTAWLPQGQLLTAIQHGINLFLLPVLLPGLHIAPHALREILNTFAIHTIIVINCLFVLVFALAAFVPRITWSDRLLLTIVAITPFYMAGGNAPAALYWPDYPLLNAALVVLAVLIFQLTWRAENMRRLWVWAIGVGLLGGLLAANKVTMGILALPCAAAVIFSRPRPLGVIVGRAALTGTAAVVAMGFFFFAAGAFRLAWLRGIGPKWLTFVLNPGGDEGFSISVVLAYFKSGGLGIMAAWWAVAFILAALSLRIKDDRRWQRIAILLSTWLLAFATVWSVVKRPAQTTLSDACLLLLALGAMLTTIVPTARPKRVALAAFSVICGAAVIWVNPTALPRSWIQNARPIADEHWAFFQKALMTAQGRPIRYYIPTNHYQSGDPFIIILKGSSDFPTWHVGSNGQWIIDRFSPGLAFVSDADPPFGTDPVPPNSVAVWFDFPTLAKVPAHYPMLQEARERKGVTEISEHMPHAGVTGHIAQIP